MQKLDILAFGAHPDDVELGCGGTLFAAVAEGKKIGIIDLTQGELGTRGTVADRLKEASKINLSLSTLCHVISSLTDPKCTYIPYRDSKLTRIL